MTNETASNERNMNRTLKAILLSAGLCSLPSLCFSAIVYDNTSTDLVRQYSPTTPTLEFGDEITLDPLTAGIRTLSRIDFYATLNNAPSATIQKVQLRLYANTGVNNSPAATPFYTSELIQLATGPQTYGLVPPPGSNFILPETFTWSVQFSSLGAGETGGLLLYGPPGTGTSDPSFFWQKDGAGAWGQMFIGGGVRSDFGARVTAVPEPGILVLGGLGALLLVGLRSFRR